MLIQCLSLPRELNGGSCLAMLGDKCVAIACDLRLGNQALTINCDFEKVSKFVEETIRRSGLNPRRSIYTRSSRSLPEHTPAFLDLQQIQ